MVFVEDEKALAEAVRSGAGAIVAGEFARGATGKAMLISSQPKLAFSRIAAQLSPRPAPKAFLHPSAAVSSSAKIGANVEIGAHAVVEDDVVIGEGSRIGAGCYVGKRRSPRRGLRTQAECHDLRGNDSQGSLYLPFRRGVGQRRIRICARSHDR